MADSRTDTKYVHLARDTICQESGKLSNTNVVILKGCIFKLEGGPIDLRWDNLNIKKIYDDTRLRYNKYIKFTSPQWDKKRHKK